MVLFRGGSGAAGQVQDVEKGRNKLERMVLARFDVSFGSASEKNPVANGDCQVQDEEFRMTI